MTAAAIAVQAREWDRSIGAMILEWFIFLSRLVVTLAFMSPAILMNLASLQNRGSIMCFASVVLVIGAAFALHCLMHRPAEQKLFFLLMTPVLIFMSMFTAIRNIGGIRETAAAERQAHNEAKEDLKTQLASLRERRKAQSKIAGEDAPQVIQGNIEALKAKYIYKWNATNGCQPEQVASTEAKTLCNGVRDLQIKLDAAKERDKLQGLIDGLDAKKEAPQISAPLGVPVSNDALLHALDRAGFKMDGSEVDYAYEAGFVLALELIAAGAPLMFGLRLPESRRRKIEAAEAEARHLEAEERRREAEARFAADFEARAAAEAEKKTKAERAAKRTAAKTREKGDPETVKVWLNSKRVVHSPGHVLELPAAHVDYEADCKVHGETPVARGKCFAAELRKLGIDVRERGKRGRFEVHGLALVPHAGGGKLRVVSSR